MHERAHQFTLHRHARPASEVLKKQAHLSFLAYEAAVKDGDAIAAAAAKQRFLAASARLAPRRVTRGGGV